MPSTVHTHAKPELYHGLLQTTFRGVEHDVSTPDAPIQQFRGIKFASIPARFRQSKLHIAMMPRIRSLQHSIDENSIVLAIERCTS